MQNNVPKIFFIFSVITKRWNLPLVIKNRKNVKQDVSRPPLLRSSIFEVLQNILKTIYNKKQLIQIILKILLTYYCFMGWRPSSFT